MTKETADSHEHVACVVLAAGLSKRFGSPKMCQALSDGQPMIVASIARYAEIFHQVFVVVDDADHQLESLLESHSADLPMVGVRSNNSAQGMSQSLIAGIHGAENASGWMIALGDMPYLQTDTIAKLRALSCATNIIIPRCHGRVGNPVVFGADFKTALLALKGDQGGKPVTRANADQVVYLDVDDEGVLQDIDYPSAIL
jgi:molybdenum cofactor cytidylyltransferase